MIGITLSGIDMFIYFNGTKEGDSAWYNFI
jgi:hypothetical protein